MAYSFSFDASLKLRGCDIKGFLNHFMREDDKEKQKRHSNECINSDLSKYNMTLVYNADTGKMQQATDSRQIMDAINRRLSDAIDLKTNTYRTTGKKLRSDAVQCRGFVMQIDPEFYNENKGNSEIIIKSFNDMLQLAKKRFSAKNVIAVSGHLDETNPHLHLLMTPVTDDNRLSQKDFIDKKKLQVAHKEMREELRSKGYDIDLERRTPYNAKRLSERDYKALKDSEKRLNELNDFEVSLKQRKTQLDDVEKQLVSERQEFEHFRASESQRLEAETQHSRQIEQQATSKLKEVEGLYNKSKKIHGKLMNLSDVFTEQYADGLAYELGYVRKSMKKSLSR